MLINDFGIFLTFTTKLITLLVPTSKNIASLLFFVTMKVAILADSQPSYRLPMALSLQRILQQTLTENALFSLY